MRFDASMTNNCSHVRALIAGGCASVVGQTIIVPFDVISQHMMIVGMRQNNLPGGYSLHFNSHLIILWVGL